MKKDKELTKVVFRIVRYPDDGQEEIVAFLPTAPANPGRILCYAHVGQHSEADYSFYNSCSSPCAPSKYNPLKREMERLFGYNFKVMQRITARDRALAWTIGMCKTETKKK